MAIKIVNLNKNFAEKNIFKNFSYDFDDNGIYVLKGKSGSGKTTLFRMISGLDKDYQGEISISDASVVSYCFQEHRLFPWLNAIDNIVLPIKDKDNSELYSKALEILTKLNFSKQDTKLFPSELSGGMKQRVAFARSILMPSEILLLDEVTKELDLDLSYKILDIIKEEANHKLIIVVTHKEFEAEYLSAKIIEI